jgi:hypothetical protein
MGIFSITTATLLQNMSSSITNINQGESEENGPAELLGVVDYTLIEPMTGYAITNALVKNHMVHPKDAAIVFNDTTHYNDHKYIQIIRNNSGWNPRETNPGTWQKYKNFISVQRQSGDMIGWGTKWQGTAISYESIVSHFDWKTNTSVITFGIGGRNDTIFVHLATNDTSLIWANNYTIYYAFYTLRGGTVDMWGTIRTVVLMQIPGLDPTLQILISGLWTFSMIFIGFTLITRLIPFLGGG